MSNSKPAYLNVLIVEHFETAAGRTVRNWTKVGVAFPRAEGGGFNIELKAFPRDGKLVVLPPQPDERADKGSEANGAAGDAARATKVPAATPASEIVARIESLQAVQTRNPPSSTEWQLASDALQPLFREMARRQKANGGELEWRKWK